MTFGASEHDVTSNINRRSIEQDIIDGFDAL